MIKRKITIPIVVTIMLGIFCIVFTFYFIGKSEFEYSRWSRELGELRPQLTGIYRSALPFSWLFLVATIVTGTDILRRNQCSIRYLAWYCCFVGIFCITWMIFSGLAYYLVYAKLNHFL